MSFNHLKKFEIDGDPVEYPLYQLGGAAKLFLLSATEKNRRYHDALLKRNAKLAARLRAGSKMDRATLQELREHDKILYAKFVITGWEGIEDDAGNDVAFTPDVCRQFLGVLPDWIFDDVRQYATSPANFLKDDEPDTSDEEALAGN